MTSPPSFDVIVASALAALASKLGQLAFELSGAPALPSEVHGQLMQRGAQAADLRRAHITERQRKVLQ
jgi:hypothetical protein